MLTVKEEGCELGRSCVDTFGEKTLFPGGTNKKRSFSYDPETP
jgi:hypothetical protein